MGVLLYKMNKRWWFVLVNKTMLYSRAWVDNSSGSLILPSSLINWSDMAYKSSRPKETKQDSKV